jgi:hypothetical protein
VRGGLKIIPTMIETSQRSTLIIEDISRMTPWSLEKRMMMLATAAGPGGAACIMVFSPSPDDPFFDLCCEAAAAAAASCGMPHVERVRKLCQKLVRVLFRTTSITGLSSLLEEDELVLGQADGSSGGAAELETPLAAAAELELLQEELKRPPAKIILRRIA